MRQLSWMLFGDGRVGGEHERNVGIDEFIVASTTAGFRLAEDSCSARRAGSQPPSPSHPRCSADNTGPHPRSLAT